MKMTQDASVQNMTCYFCEGKLKTEPPVSDSEAWADWVIGDHSVPIEEREQLHILAHAYCAENQRGIERG